MLFKPGLYLVATPIGNLDDITIRAIELLKHSDFIFCENTRSSNKLLQKHSINTKLKVYNDHSSASLSEIIIQYIEEGKIISLISDAGSPLISDPGYKLVRELKKKKCFIDILPGPCSPIAALTISGLATDKFLFAGFLPKTTILRTKFFEEFKDSSATLIFFETANRLYATLVVALKVFGDRTACVVREITKIYQEVKNDSLVNLIGYYQNNAPKGEIVLLISRKTNKDLLDTSNAQDADNTLINKNIIKKLKTLLKDGLTTKSAIDHLYNEYSLNYSRKEIYNMVNLYKNNKSASK